MKIVIEFYQFGEVTPEVVRQSVETAVRNQEGNGGLSDDNDEGYILIRSVEIVE